MPASATDFLALFLAAPVALGTLVTVADAASAARQKCGEGRGASRGSVARTGRGGSRGLSRRGEISLKR